GRGGGDGWGGGEGGGEGDRERADEGVPRPDGVHRVDPERADRAGRVRAGQGDTVRARGDDGVPRARGDQGGGGLARFGQAADRPAEHGGGLRLVHHQPVHAGRDEGGGVRRGGRQVEDAARCRGQFRFGQFRFGQFRF